MSLTLFFVSKKRLGVIGKVLDRAMFVHTCGVTTASCIAAAATDQADIVVYFPQGL